MATVYKLEIVSHWVNYSEKRLSEKIKKLLESDDRKNEVSVNVKKI